MALGLRGTKGVAAPPYTAGPYSWDQFVTFAAGFAGAMTTGKCFFVDPRGWEYGKGSSQNSGESWDEALPTIQSAVDKCVDKRGDIIFVGAGANAKNTAHWTGTSEHPDYQKIKENVLIYDKSNIHILAVPFRSPASHQFRPSDGAGNYLEAYPGTRTTYAISLLGAVISNTVGFVVMSPDVEIAGFCIDVGGGKVGIYIGDGSGMTLTGDAEGEEGASANSAYIHDNYFRGGSEGTTGAGIVLSGCGSDIIIENNKIDTCGGFGIYIGSGSEKTNERPCIRGNIFNDNKGYGIYSYGSSTNRGIGILSNVFQDGDNTATYQIALAAAGGADLHALIAGNHFSCTNTMSIQTTNTTSGNFKMVTTGTPTYVTEA